MAVQEVAQPTSVAGTTRAVAAAVQAGWVVRQVPIPAVQVAQDRRRASRVLPPSTAVAVVVAFMGLVELQVRAAKVAAGPASSTPQPRLRAALPTLVAVAAVALHRAARRAKAVPAARASWWFGTRCPYQEHPT